MTSTAETCSVCLEILEVHTYATCNICGEPYHLNHRQDLPGKDCGEVWLSDETMSLEFGCLTCLQAPTAGGALDDILDSAEAAQLTGLPEVALIQAATTGHLRHRRTSGGVYLFERGDLLAMRDRPA